MSALSSILFGTNTVLNAAGTYAQTQALRDQAGFQRRALEQNAALSRARAQDALDRGYEAEVAHRRSVRRLQGSQRAAMGAQGLDLSRGTPLDVVSETGALGALDALTIRNNARREALGYQQEAGNYDIQRELARSTARNRIGSTILTGGMQAVRDWGSAYDLSTRDPNRGRF